MCDSMNDNPMSIRPVDDPKFREDWEAFIQEFSQESDRACALLGAAYLDELLTELLLSFLIDDKESMNLLGLEKPYAPIGTFSSKILTCFCLGMMDRIQFKDLTSIRRIRNKFAHSLHGLSFQESEIEKECNRLMVHRMTPFNLDARNKFVTTVMILSVDIDAQRRDFLPQRRTIPDYFGFLADQ